MGGKMELKETMQSAQKTCMLMTYDNLIIIGWRIKLVNHCYAIQEAKKSPVLGRQSFIWIFSSIYISQNSTTFFEYPSL
jgi:hypothetical protein